jgi:hypothetical protein
MTPITRDLYRDHDFWICEICLEDTSESSSSDESDGLHDLHNLDLALAHPPVN